MNPSSVVFLPRDTPQWLEIKANLKKISEGSVYSISDLVGLLDYVEHIVNWSHPPNSLLQLLPSRDTFVGLGNYLYFHVRKERREYLLSFLIPRIIEFALDDNIALASPLLYSNAFEEFSIAPSRKCIASWIASSFLCLFPNAQTQNFLLNDINFNYFYRGIGKVRCGKVEKLDALFDYFEHVHQHCGRTIAVDEEAASDCFRITRRSLDEHLQLPSKERLVNILLGHQLPMALVEYSLTKETLAEQFGLPMIDFTNGYVGGSTLRTSEFPLFFRYPETLAALTLCCRLEGAEALWIDNCLGPFGHQNNSSNVHRRQRIVICNSTRFPAWASELQYSEVCLITDIVKSTAGLFQVNLKNENIWKCSISQPFSDDWWAKCPCGSLTPSESLLSMKEKRTKLEATNCSEDLIISQFAEAMTVRIIEGALKSTKLVSKDRQSRKQKTRRSKSEINVTPTTANLPTAFRDVLINHSKLPAINFSKTTNLTIKFCFEDSISNNSLDVPEQLERTASQMTVKIVSEACLEAIKRMRSINHFATSMMQSLIHDCLKSTRSNTVQPRHFPLYVDTNIAAKKKTPWFTPRTDYRQVKDTTPYRDRLSAFAASLSSRSVLGALIQLKKDHYASNNQSEKHSLNEQASSGTGIVSAAPSNNGADAQISLVVQWIAAAVASSSASASSDRLCCETSSQKENPFAKQSRYLSPIVFATNGNLDVQQLHSIVGLVQSAGWSAGHLLQALLDYSDYRSNFLVVGHEDEPLVRSSPSPATEVVLPFFDYLFSRFASLSEHHFISSFY